jgi:hypothetical protein
MNRSKSRSRPSMAAVLGLAVAGLLAAPSARAQTAVSAITPSVRGVVTAANAESVTCSGSVSVTAKAVTPTNAAVTPTSIVVGVDARGLTCTGVTSGASYANTGVANLTRVLVSQDVIQTTFAVYPDVPGGFRSARTALLTLNLTYNVSTGAISGGTGGVGNL